MSASKLRAARCCLDLMHSDLLGIAAVNSEQPATTRRTVFISDSERDGVQAFLHSVARSAVLTISAIDGSAADGGIVGLGSSTTGIHYEINAAASQRARLQIRTQFLRLAAHFDTARTDPKP